MGCFLKFIFSSFLTFMTRSDRKRERKAIESIRKKKKDGNAP